MFRAPKSPVSPQDTAAARKYSGSMGSPAQHAYWVACRASCATSGGMVASVA